MAHTRLMIVTCLLLGGGLSVTLLHHHRPSFADDSTSKGRNQIHLSDLLKLQMIGLLGKPMGDYSTIVGVYHNSNADVGFSEIDFTVTILDGKPLAEPIVFDRLGWDHQTLPSPKWKDGEQWELRGRESCGFSGIPRNYRTEVGQFQGHLEYKLRTTFVAHRAKKLLP